ncbi:MAG TPA: hypothetical protein VGQ35_13865 [Dongiaceae bacterium]|jgi:hypothetical protein|nr:hypothetical protein [Dongiaceae bacterium]
MSDRQEGLPATSLFLLATALLLFGVGGGLVGYMVGERHGESRANTIVGALAVQWDASRADGASRFDEAIGSAVARLEKAAADLKAEVSMYHGCGAICNAIAYQFGEELLHARDAVRKIEPPTLPQWSEALRQGGIPIEAGTDPSARSAVDVQLTGRFSRSAVIAAVALLSATVAACFGMACATVLKLRAAGAETI